MMDDSTHVAAADPRGTYSKRLAARRADSAAHTLRDEAFSYARLAVAASAVAAGWLVFGARTIPFYALAIPVAVFIVLAVAHDRVIRARRRADRAAAFYERGIARLDGAWAGQGEPGARFVDPDHLYAADLDLFGRGSLFELMNTTRTRAGEETLAAWLKSPADPGEIRARQEAVAELRGRIDLREDLSLLGEDVRAGLHPEALKMWGAVPRIAFAPWERAAATILASAAVTALIGWAVAPAFRAPALAILAVEGIVAWVQRERVGRVIAAADFAARDLSLLSEALRRIESESFGCERLKRARASLFTGGEPPSRRIVRLRRLVELLDSRRNQFFYPVSLVLMWGTHLAHAIEGWRGENGEAVARWLSGLGEIETLAAFGGHAFERPEEVFPIIEKAGPVFEGEALGHPLIAAPRRVHNDVSLGKPSRVFVVSGSNMSGKSTLLRTVGINAVLAQAGSTVCAKRLRLSPLSVGGTLRIQDSLQAGTSRFYAEITRLRALVDLTTGPRPVLFLIDEILHGTNSHDRLRGAEAVVRGLVERGAIGLVTTHDLALARIAETLGEKAENVHFEDHLEEGRMSFDYRLRKGVVEKSNAIALMKSVGLEV